MTHTTFSYLFCYFTAIATGPEIPDNLDGGPDDVDELWVTAIIIGLLLVTGVCLLLVYVMRWIATFVLWTYIFLLELLLLKSNLNIYFLSFIGKSVCGQEMFPTF